MAHGEEYSANLVVAIDGVELPDDVAPLVTSAVVDARRGAPAGFVLRFADEHGMVLDKAGIKVGAKAKVAVQLSGPGGPRTLLEGTVTTLETEIGPNGRSTTVRGFDVAHKLVGARRYATYVNVTAADVVSQVAARAGIPARVTATSPVLEHVVQNHVTDWELLQRLALESGSTLGAHEGKLVLDKPPQASSGPSGTSGARRDPLVVEHGVNLLGLRASVTSASQVPSVEARGWDPRAKRAVVASATAAARGVALPKATPKSLAQKTGAPALVVTSAAHDAQAQVEGHARSVADRVAGSCAELEAAVQGNPAMVVGAAVALVGCGEPFDGRYVVSAARHEFSGDQGYRTTIVVSDASDRSLYGVARGPGATSARTGPDVAPAIVTDVDDPDGLGRVRLRIPTAGDEAQTWWARVVQLGAGKERGLVLMPEVGDEVLALLTEGGNGQPYVLGGMFNGKDLPRQGWKGHVATGEVVRRSLTSRTGMFVELVEETGKESIVLSSKDGKQVVSVVTKPDAAVQIASSGKVELTAQQDATVTAQGNVTVKGTKVVLEGTTDVELKAPTIKVAAQSTLDLSGATVKVAAQGMAELASSGITVVKGSMVKIN